MSWLLAVFIPGLLMLATFGLGRVESRLGSNDPQADAIPEWLSHPPSSARPAQPSAAHLWQPTRHERAHPAFVGFSTLGDEPGLPTRLFGHERANPQFSPTRHTNPV